MFGERRTYRCYNDYYCVFILQLFKNQFNVNILKKDETLVWTAYSDFFLSYLRLDAK